MSAIARIRSFNRTVTSQVGALSGDYLGRPRSLGASRVLFEIGPGGVEIRELRDRLGLDSGYLSRLVRTLERDKLLRTAPAPGDARARLLRLTAAGRRELGVLNRLSNRIAARMIASLTPEQRARLIEAMSTVQRLLFAGSVRVELEPASSHTARYCLAQYFRELNQRFEQGFRPARSVTPVEEMTPPRGYFVIATLQGQPLGCGALICHPGWGHIRRMWVAPTSRGLGLGSRILGKLEALARRRRLKVVKLETNRALKEAQSLYRSRGYREVKAFNDEPYAHHWFAKKL